MNGSSVKNRVKINESCKNGIKTNESCEKNPREHKRIV